MNNCPECNNKLEYNDKIIAIYYCCNKCGFELLDFPDKCCNYPKPLPTKVYSDDIEAMQDTDNYKIFNQCQNCGKKIGTAISKSIYKKDELHIFNVGLENKISELRKEINTLSVEIEKRKRERNRDKYWDDYNEYLKSEKWYNIRKIVLDRDKNICQSCLCKPATQVHHTISVFRKNEPLFSLISVCDDCHSIITDIERGRHKDAKKITYKFDLEN
jgi:5-methylcytosine-specific restriction endonuclease McrA